MLPCPVVGVLAEVAAKLDDREESKETKETKDGKASQDDSASEHKMSITRAGAALVQHVVSNVFWSLASRTAFAPWLHLSPYG